MKKMLTILLIVACFKGYPQSSTDLEKFIIAVDSQVAKLKSDTSKIRGWSSELGNYEETIYLEFKLAANNDLVRVLVDNPGKEKILYYFNKGKLLGAKVEMSKEFKTWEGKSLAIRQPEPKRGEVTLTSPDDQTYENVSQQLAVDGYGWKSHYKKIKE
ncbi:hypothetical protein WG906_06145 [Pedobacter sp. P351]|uniref:hypothetical protein n=1 Tax=Pedobacter superstes TaxID=3133441 RepID=UPI0030B7447C